MTFFSKYFSYEEMTRTAVAEFKLKNQAQGLLYLAPLRQLATEQLLPIREGLGLPVRLNSVFRGADLNKAIGGAAASQHCLGQAADFNVGEFYAREDQLKVMKWIVDNNIPFGQLLLERGCIHISAPRAGRLQEVAEYDVPTKTKKPVDLAGISLKDFPTIIPKEVP